MDDTKKAIVMHAQDNVAVVLNDIKAGEIIKIIYENTVTEELVSKEDIEIYHKIALTDIQKQEDILKYGEIIGTAVQAIKMGEHVHVEQIEGVSVKYANKSV